MNVFSGARQVAAKMNSLLVKTTLISGFAALLVVAAIMAIDRINGTKQMREAVSLRAVDVTDLLALQMGGSIKFGNERAITEIVTGTVGTAGADLLGAYVVSETGTVLYSSEETGEMGGTMAALIARAFETGQRAFSDDGLIVASPALFGEEGAAVGVVVTSWTDARKIAQLHADEIGQIMAGLLILFTALILMSVFLWFAMSRPLNALGQAMRRVSDNDFDTEIPYVTRTDEVGQMAARLEDFRTSLARAKSAERENAFKSAAYEGSSAALMMVDENLTVQYVNPACEQLLKDVWQDLAGQWRGAELARLQGASLASLENVARKIGTGTSVEELPDPCNVTARLGARHIRIKINKARDPEGGIIGAVVEWSDRTISQRNAALLDGIDVTQLRVEFDTSGQVTGLNTLAASKLGLDRDNLEDVRLETLFLAQQSGAVGVSEIATMTRDGAALNGKFDMNAAGGAPLVIDGGFIYVRAEDDLVERVILLASDVTEAETHIRKARELQARTGSEQKMVVDALGSGLQSLSSGDLTTEITDTFPQDYEALRIDFNTAVAGLKEAVGAVTQNVSSIRSETSEISSAADDLSRRTEKQAATLEETAAALDELTSSVRSAAEGADAGARVLVERVLGALLVHGGVLLGGAVGLLQGPHAFREEVVGKRLHALPRLQRNLLPDCGFVVKRPLAADARLRAAQRAELHMGDPHHIDLRTCGRAERTPAIVCAPKAPADGGAGRHHRIVTPDHMVDLEIRVGEGRAQAQPERIRRSMAVGRKAPGVFKMTGAIILGRDDRELCRHHPGQQVGMALAPLVFIAPSLIGAFDVILRRRRCPAPACCHLGKGPVARVLPHLTQRRAVVADQPFVGDLVVLGIAVGNRPVGERLACRGAEHPVARVGGGGENAVGRQEPHIGVARPDHILAQEHAVGKLVKR